MVDIELSNKNHWFRDCTSPEAVALLKLVLIENFMEHEESLHEAGPGVKHLRIYLNEADYEDLPVFEREMEEMRNDQAVEEKIRRLARNYSWVGKPEA